MRKRATIIICVIGLFAFLIGRIVVADFIAARDLAKVDIQKVIIGTWKGEVKVPTSDSMLTITFYPDKNFKVEGEIFLKSGKKIPITYSGNYEIADNNIIYTITATNRPDIWSVGNTHSDKIVRLTPDLFGYSSKSGKRVYLHRVTTPQNKGAV